MIVYINPDIALYLPKITFMIQRVQNLYLLLALVCLIVAVFIPIGTYHFTLEGFISGDLELTPMKETLINANYNKQETNLNMDNIAIFESGRFFPFIVINSVLSALILLTISRFKKLESQFKLNRISLLLSALILIVLIAAVFIIPGLFSQGVLDQFVIDVEKLGGAEVVGSFSTGIGYYLYFAAVSFIFLASVGIKKDIRLLKSIDRIR